MARVPLQQALQCEEKMVVGGFSFLRSVLLVLIVYSCCIAAAAAAVATDPQVPAVIIFGDSTSDVGMNTFLSTLVRSDFAPYGENFEGGKATGRFTNGYMINDFIALNLGLPLNLPYLHPEATGERMLKGVNFASAASGYLQATSRLLNVVPAFEQLQMFYKYQMQMVSLVGQERASFIISEALFGLSTGSNDFIMNYLVNPILQKQHTTYEWSSFILSNQTQFLKQLYKAGARKFLIFGFPPIGCLPAQLTLSGKVGHRSQGCIQHLNDISVSHNTRLQAAISQWQSELPGVRIMYGDAYTYISIAANNPAKYGYTESRRGCCAEGLVSAAIFCNPLSPGTCSDPSTYMFFDSVHPTETVYRVLAKATWDAMVPFFGLKS